MILTDGEIHDMEAVKGLLCESSKLPTSVIIVGVGNEQFTMMEELDCDGAMLRGQGKTAVRDIVQFVKFKECLARGNLAE
jgi:copine 1/2/3